jgi:2'-5' RNA ligase
MRIRTFIAIGITPDVRRAAEKLIDLLRPVTADVKWVAPENLHWTLQFLGDVDELEIPAVCTAVSTAAAQIEVFDLQVRGVGAFPSADRPHTIWLGAGAGSQAIIALQKAIEKKLKHLGYRGEERRFVPHITLGRTGRKSRPRPLVRELTALAEYDGGTMLVQEVAIYASQLGPTGPTYAVLGRAPLA